MARTPLPPTLIGLLTAAVSLVEQSRASAVLMLADIPYDLKAVKEILGDSRLIVASHKPDVQQACLDDQVTLVPLMQEPLTRQVQVSQALLEAIADNLVSTGDQVVVVYTAFDREHIDTISVVSLSERLARLTTRDLQRLETQVPLETLRRVVDLAVEIGREGREGHKVGTLFVVGQHRKVIEMSHEGVHDPFRGYAAKERMITNARVRESMKELAQIDGAFVISAEGVVIAAGRILDAAAEDITLSKGLGARHWAAAGISKATKAIAIAVSESTGTVRIFQDGIVVLRIEPMNQAMKWHEVATEPPDE